MKTLIKNECDRAFKNKWLYITLLVCLLIIIYDLVVEVIPTRNAMNVYMDSNYPVPNVYNRWMELNNSTASKLFHFIFPLLICIPYSMSIYTDIKSKYSYNIIVRTDKKKYFLSKLIVQFMTGFLVVMFTMTVSFMLTAAIVPFGTPFAGLPVYSGGPLCLLGSAFFKQPLIVSICIMLIESLMFALIGCLAYTFAYILDNGIMVITSAFILYFFENVISPLFGDTYTLIICSDPLNITYFNVTKVAIELLVVAAVIAITYFIRSKVKDEL